MRPGVRRILLPAFLLAGSAACAVGDEPSPVGVELPPGGILEGGLQVAVSEGFDLATDYRIFPAERAESDRITTALEFPEAPGYESRALFRFSVVELDSLPEGTRVVSAAVRLSYSPTPEAPVEFALHPVTSEWSEEAATWERRLLGEDWETPGGDFEEEPIAVFEIGPDEPDSVRVTIPIEQIEEWRAGEVPNHGLILVQRTPGARVEFASRGLEGSNPNGPSLQVEVELPEAGTPSALGSIPAREDVFIVVDREPLAADPGLLVNAAEPVRRVFLEPVLGGLPAGATVARAQLVLFVDAVRLPEDSLQVLALPASSGFLGEKTVLPSPSVLNLLGVAKVSTETLPGDSVVFEGSSLTAVVRAWFRRPESVTGIGFLVLGEQIVFGGVRFHGLEAPPELRPHIRLVYLSPQVPAGP